MLRYSDNVVKMGKRQINKICLKSSFEADNVASVLNKGVKLSLSILIRGKTEFIYTK